MTGTSSDRINDLIDSEQWGKARSLIEKELTREPDNHWLLTQLGAGADAIF